MIFFSIPFANNSPTHRLNSRLGWNINIITQITFITIIDRYSQTARLIPIMDIEAKYKRALKQLSQLIKANRLLDSQLESLNHPPSLKHNHQQLLIQKQQLQKAYEKALQQKSKLLLQKEQTQLESKRLNQTIKQLQETLAHLKRDKINLTREKQTFEHKYQMPKSDQPGAQQFSSKNQVLTSKNDASLFCNGNQAQYLIEEVNQQQQTGAQLRSTIRQLERKNKQLENKLETFELNEPDFQRFLSELKCQRVLIKNLDTQIKDNDSVDWQKQARQKVKLLVRVTELQVQLEQRKAAFKRTENELLNSEEIKMQNGALTKIIQDLEQQNRILNGRIIVLEAKEVVVNSGQDCDLEDRVLDFQNRVQLLLTEKDNNSKPEHVSIHQLISLKSYILELDSKLKCLANENQFANKRYKAYKEKYLKLHKHHQQHEQLIESYKLKLIGYDRLCLKMQGQLARALKTQDIELSTMGIKNKQDIDIIEAYRRKIIALTQKLEIQKKFNKQQSQAMKLKHESQIMASHSSETKSLKQKNQELENRLIQKQRELNQCTKSKDFSVNQLKESGQLIEVLRERLIQKDSVVANMELEARNAEQQWKRRFSQLQLQNMRLRQHQRQTPFPPFNSHHQESTVFSMEQEIRKQKNKIAELQNELMVKTLRESLHRDSNKEPQLSQIVSQLEFQLEKLNEKLSTAENIRKKYEQKNSTLNQKILKLQNQLQKCKNGKDESNSPIDRKQHRQLRGRYSHERLFTVEDLKQRGIIFDLVTLKSQIAKSEQGSRIIFNKGQHTHMNHDTLLFKYEILMEEKQQLQRTASRLQNRLREVEKQLGQKQSTLLRIQSQFKHTKARLQMTGAFTVRNIQYQADIQDLNQSLSRLNQQIFRLGRENALLKENTVQKQKVVSSLKTEIHRLSLSSEEPGIMKVSVQLQKTKQQNSQLRNQMDAAHYNLQRNQEEINYLKDTNKRLREEFRDFQTRFSHSQFSALSTDNRLQILTRENTQYRESLRENEKKMNQITDQLYKMRSENRQVTILREQNLKFRLSIRQSDEETSKLRKKIIDLETGPWQMMREVTEEESRQNLQEEVESLGQKNRILESNLVNASVNFEHFKSQSENLNRLIRRLQEQIDLLRMSRQDESFESYHLIRVSELQRQVQKLTEQASRSVLLYQQHLQLKIKYEDLEVKANQYQFEIRHLKIQIQQENQEKEVKQQKLNQISRLYNEVREQRAQTICLHETVLEREKQIHRLEEQIFELKKNNPRWSSSAMVLPSESIKAKNYAQTSRTDNAFDSEVENRLRDKISEKNELIQTLEHIISSESENKASEFNAKIQRLQLGVRAYEQEIKRLGDIVEQLEQEVRFLRLKLTEMTNQEQRVEENLSTMVLSFAEIEALRDRMKAKQDQISQFRRSLLRLSGLESSDSASSNEISSEKQFSQKKKRQQIQAGNKMAKLKSSFFSRPSSTQPPANPRTVYAPHQNDSSQRTVDTTSYKCQQAGSLSFLKSVHKLEI